MAVAREQGSLQAIGKPEALQQEPGSEVFSSATIAFSISPTRLSATYIHISKDEVKLVHRMGLHHPGGTCGNGLGALATLDETGLAVHLWNLQPDGKTKVRAEVSVVNLPPILRRGPLVVRWYLIGSKHSNCLTAPDRLGGLEMVEERRIDGPPDFLLAAELEPMALCLWYVERTAPERQRRTESTISGIGRIRSPTAPPTGRFSTPTARAVSV